MNSRRYQPPHKRVTSGIVDVDEFAKQRHQSESLDGDLELLIEDARSDLEEMLEGLNEVPVGAHSRSSRATGSGKQTCNQDTKLKLLEEKFMRQEKEVAQMKRTVQLMASSGTRNRDPVVGETPSGFTSIIDVDDMTLRTFPDNLDSAQKQIEMKCLAGTLEQGPDKGKKRNLMVEHSDEWHAPFSESTYTLLYMCGVKSQAFWYAVFIYSLQITTIVLTLVDIIDPEKVDNVLQIPAMVSVIVTASQAVTLFLALAYQSDLIEAVLKLHDGYHPEVMERYPGATRVTWMFSCVAQLIAGLLLLSTIFVLTMQADNVLAMMLNFAALHFMAEIDDLGFAIAKMGFISNELRHETENVVDFKVPNRDKGNYFRRILYLLAWVSLAVGYGWLKSMQLNGRYLQSILYVQFGDSHDPKIPYYSGLMSSENTRTPGYREYRDVGTQNILLAYCHKENTWTFSDTGDPCKFFAQSPRTRSYDVTSISSSQWVIKDPLSRLAPFESFTLLGRDCDAQICDGVCEDGMCVCPRDKFGMDCEFTDVCPELNINEQFDPFPKGRDNWAVSLNFPQLLDASTRDPIRVYNMPVYYAKSTFPANIIFFAGHRWILTSELELFGEDPFLEQTLYANTTNTTAELYLQNKTADFLKSRAFHAHHKASYIPYFLSEPVDFQSPDFRPTPSGLWWSDVVVLNETDRSFSIGRQVDTELLCRDCFPEHGGYCEFGNCTETGICECADGFTGIRCDIPDRCYNQEWPCYGNGVCDEISGECRCNPHNYGKVCDIDYWCIEEDGKCANGGICNFTTRWCDCVDPATWGNSCEKVDDCKVWGCANGGICNQDTGICVCPDPYYGFGCGLVNETAELQLCFEENCNGGYCDEYRGICTCNDTNSYGAYCEHQYNCTMSGCMNRGICNNVTELCECQEPYTGRDCYDILDCTSDSGCLGSGTCNITTGECDCEDPFFGKGCEFTFDCREREDGCYNGGNCLSGGQCECEYPFSGRLCWLILGVENPWVEPEDDA